jgi:hypothetical protein
MTQLHQLPGTDPTADRHAWTDEPVVWTADTPDWSIPPARVQRPPVGPQPSDRRKGRLLLAAVAIAGVLVGAIATPIFVTTAFVSAAEDIGRGMSVGSDIGRSVGQGISHSVPGPASGSVRQFPPVAPTDLGSDRALDASAQSCFGGDLQACDQLRVESAPLSAYETYAATCGGRVKRDSVPACTDLH